MEEIEIVMKSEFINVLIHVTPRINKSFLPDIIDYRLTEATWSQSEGVPTENAY